MIKKYKIKITASAQSDFRTIWDYISQNNPKNAEEFLAEIEKRINHLSFSPQRNPVIPEGEFLQINEYRHFLYKKYRVVFSIKKFILLILMII
jgi:plasmid stabilization system protein ParE